MKSSGRRPSQNHVLLPKIDAVCPEDLTPKFIASLKRAFQACGLFLAPISGSLDVPMRHTIMNFQSVLGVKSATVMKACAQKIGPIVVDHIA